MEEWLTTYEAADLAKYKLDYVRKLIRAKKSLGENETRPGKSAGIP
jgi:hypothetical protein